MNPDTYDPTFYYEPYQKPDGSYGVRPACNQNNYATCRRCNPEARCTHSDHVICVRCPLDQTPVRNETMPQSIHYQLDPVEPELLSKCLHTFLMFEERQLLYRRLLEAQNEAKIQHVRVAEIVADKESYLDRKVRYGFVEGTLTDAGRNLAGDPQHNSVLVVDGKMHYVGHDHTVNILPQES